MKPGVEFEVELDGELDQKWKNYFSGLSMAYRRGKTIFCGVLADQSAVLGFLNQLHGMGFVILSYRRIRRTL